MSTTQIFYLHTIWFLFDNKIFIRPLFGSDKVIYLISKNSRGKAITRLVALVLSPADYLTCKRCNRNNHLLVSGLGRDASCVYAIIDTYEVLDQLARRTRASARARARTSSYFLKYKEEPAVAREHEIHFSITEYLYFIESKALHAPNIVIN